MGLVHTKITLKNANDMMKADEGLILGNEIRKTTVNALVDSGAWTMVINNKTLKKLGLKEGRTAPGTLADGTKARYKLAGPVEISWKDRSVICEALVVPHAEENLLGAIPLEAMDLTINPRSEEVIGAHGDQMMHSLK